jgi:hypothetical protein
LYLPLYCGGGKYTLHLNDQADFIFLKELLISFFKKKAIIQEAFHNGHPSTFYLKFSNNNNNNNINKDEKALIQAIPTSGKYEIKIFPCYNRQFDEHVSQKGFEKLVDLMERSFGKKKKTNTNTFHTKNDDDIEKKKKKNNENDDAKLFCIKILTEEFVFTLDQANILLSLFCKHTTNQLEKASAAAFLIPQILPETTMNNNILTQMNTMNTSIKKISYSLLFTKEEKEKEEIYDCFSLNPIVFFEDKDFDGKIDVCGDICALIGLTQLNEIEQTHVEKKLKGWISFNRKNPTGKYHLNLSNPIDRKILLRLFEANSCDCKFRTQYKLINVSCNNENEIKPNCFRNVKLNHGTCNLLDHFFQIPHSGILEFDFVLTKRPYACCTPLNEQAFEKFLKEFKELKVSNELKIIGLRAISSRFFFTCTQMQQLMEHFDDHTMMTTSTISTISTTMTKTKTKTKTNEFHGMNDINARGQVFMILFGRIIDENHLNEPWSILDAWTQKQIKEKIGVLNLFHPLQNLTKHELNLQKKDQRLLASILIKLSSTNEAELINVTYNEKNCEQYYWKTWINPEEDLLPHMGIFACTCRMILPIESENQLPTNSYRKRLLHTLNHKIESKEKDLSL